jgi:hypothetical protein
MANWSVTNTFSNSTTADATQVNTNFTDIINCSSDGTKDMSISALTCAGTATFNGNVTLGNASGDDITITGSLAATIAIKTNNSYNIGSSTLGLASVYLGSAGGLTTRLVGGATGSSWTLTLPTAVPTFAKSGLYSDTSGTTTFDQRTVRTVKASQTADFTAAGGDEVIPCSASGGSFTITLPAPGGTGLTGKKLTFIRTDQTLANTVTISRNSSETINGATSIKLHVQYEMYELISDGTNWYILNHTYPSQWISFTPATIGAGWGTTSGSEFYWKRVGDSVCLKGYFTTGTLFGSSCRISLPTGMSLDTSKFANKYTVGVCGNNANHSSATVVNAGNGYGIGDYIVFSSFNSGSGSLADSSGTSLSLVDGEIVGFETGPIPISGWVG